MAAASVTGRGQGMSHGTFKPDNNAGCGHCNSKRCPPQEPKPKIKRGCVVRSISGGLASHKSGGSSGIRVC
jgi:hypothetical protein